VSEKKGQRVSETIDKQQKKSKNQKNTSTGQVKIQLLVKNFSIS